MRTSTGKPLGFECHRARSLKSRSFGSFMDQYMPMVSIMTDAMFILISSGWLAISSAMDPMLYDFPWPRFPKSPMMWGLTRSILTTVVRCWSPFSPTKCFPMIPVPFVPYFSRSRGFFLLRSRS